MRKKRYKKRISATRRFLLSVVAITMLVINIIMPLQVVVAEFMINEQLNDDGEDAIESEDEVSDDSPESTEPELDIEDSTEETSVDEPSNIQDDDGIPKEENTDTEAAENNPEKLESSSVRNIVTVFSVEEMRQAIENAGNTNTPTTILLDSDSEETDIYWDWDIEKSINITNNQHIITIQSNSENQRFTIRRTSGEHRMFELYDRAHLTLGYGITLEGSGSGSLATLIYAITGSTVTMESGSVIKAIDGIGISVNMSSFIMNGGTIYGGTTGLYVGGGSADINGGTITNSSHAGIEVGGNGGSARLNEGTVSNNARGVYINGSNVRFEMNGGIITNNTTTNDDSNGAGISVHQSASATVILEEGAITNNSTQGNGGGIYIDTTHYSRNLTVSDRVKFSGNKANGAYAPPEDAASLYPDIQSTSASISIYGRADHPLNNYDIGYSAGERAYALTAVTSPVAAGNVYVSSVSELRNTFFLPNTTIEIESVANDDYVRSFQSWSSTGGGTFGDVNKAKTTFTMPTNDTKITAATQPGRPIKDIFPDENLAKVVASKLNRSVEDVVTLTILENTLGLINGDNKGIKSLKGMQHFKNLQQLTMRNNEIEDLTPISGLTRLNTLSINNNKIRDISPLANLRNLKVIDLSNNQISDIRPLESLPLVGASSVVGSQKIQLEAGEIGVPTAFNVYNMNGSIINLKLNHPGEHKNGQLIWNTAGNRSANWSGGRLQFSGQVTQSVKAGTTLMFESGPDILEFEEAPIQNNYMTINRKESMSLSIRDTRGEGSAWSIQASIDSPLTSEDGRHRLPADALVFKGSDGQITPLSNDPIEVYSGKTTSESLTTEVSWKEDEGILIHMRTIAAKADTNYTTTITWTLHDTPL